MSRFFLPIQLFTISKSEFKMRKKLPTSWEGIERQPLFESQELSPMNGNKKYVTETPRKEMQFHHTTGLYTKCQLHSQVHVKNILQCSIVGTIADLVFFALAPAYQSSSHPGFRSIILHASNRQLKNICPWDTRPETRAPQITTSDSSYPAYQA